MAEERKFQFTGLYKSVRDGVLNFNYTFMVYSEGENGLRRGDLKVCTLPEELKLKGVKVGDYVRIISELNKDQGKYILKNIIPAV